MKNSPKKNLNIELKYYQGKAVIESIDRVSRPGLRQYSQAANFKSIRNDLGISIVSTNKGVMTAKNAKKMNAIGKQHEKIKKSKGHSPRAAPRSEKWSKTLYIIAKLEKSKIWAPKV